MKKIYFFGIVFIASLCVFSLQPKKEKINNKDLINYISKELNIDSNLEFVQGHEPEIKEEIKEVKEETKEIFVINENLEKEAYKIGYKNGQNAMFKQMGKPVEEDDTDTQFAVFKEMPERESEEYKKIIQKGYVDGYHKASEDMTCPRRDY